MSLDKCDDILINKLFQIPENLINRMSKSDLLSVATKE